MPKYTPEETEALTAALLANDTLSLAELAFHLDVDRGTASSIARAHDLDLGNGQHSWGRIFRRLHRVEPARLPAHLADLKARGVSGIDDIDDLERALRRPLIDFGRMARALGSKPDTLSKALRQGRMTLPFSTIVLGGRLRHYRPLDVELWRDQGVLLELPAPLAAVRSPAPENAEPTAPDTASPDAATEVRKAVFGCFAGNKRKAAA